MVLRKYFSISKNIAADQHAGIPGLQAANPAGTTANAGRKDEFGQVFSAWHCRWHKAN
jgi:hypothetical protein